MQPFRIVRLVLVVCVFAAHVVVAQNKDDDNLGEITFEQLSDTKASLRYYAAGGGFIFGSLQLNADNINNNLPASYKLGSFPSSLLVTGGQGFVALDFTYNFRFGISSVGGTKTITADTTQNGTTVKRNLDMSASFNSVSLDYAIAVAKGLTILPGVQVGFGTFRFERYDGVTEGAVGNVGTINNSIKRLETSQFTIQPGLNIEYTISSFAMIRGYAGYNIASNGDWTENRVTKISSVEPKLNSSGLIFGAGVFVGLFRNE
ncbi:MAG: hypothetical protein JNJ85_04460 [Candidatus Kapabacteria bacterium]|nr:hypothetical protein [Candidatus Kapabacteria bacterium]MBX7155838.1 hypothetical protein [Bacteroidota bacterium]